MYRYPALLVGWLILLLLICKVNSFEEVDLLIIGAGWAGLGAADHIARTASSPVSFLVLESSDRTGGRAQAETIGDDNGPGKYVVELGAMWITGIDPGKSDATLTDRNPIQSDGSLWNPVHQLSLQSGLNTTPMLEPWTVLTQVDKVFDSQGKDADPNGNIRNKFQDAMYCLEAAIDDEEIDTSMNLRDVFSSCGWSPQTDVERAVDLAARECSGSILESESAYYWYTSEGFYGDSQEITTDQHPRGYARMLDEMVKDTLPEGDPRIIFNAHVTKIAYNDTFVLVTTRDGREFRAKEVINTMPVGVLKNNYMDLFDPPLPKERVELLATDTVINMRNVTKIIMQFPDVWWENTLNTWTFPTTDFRVWRNLNHKDLLPGSNLLLCFLSDPLSSKYEALSNDQVQQAVMSSLRSQLQDVNIPDPIHFLMSRHGMDETRFGAFSYIGTDMTHSHFEALTEPLRDSFGNPRVRFAGEASCPAQFGFTHGALQSGIEEAARYLFENDLGHDPEEQEHLDLCMF